MKKIIQKKYRNFIGYILIIGIFLVPHLSLAINLGEQCSTNGYTISTINGVFTGEKDAQENMDALKIKLGKNYNNQILDYQYLLNPSHLAGVGDILMSVYQKIFDNETVQDYDLIEMLKSASEKVKTQKLLLVAHSQGNFYANSFYDIVAGKRGGVPRESIGVYSVATPSGRVAGGGKWLTSDTDKVIAGVVGRVPFKNIMSPNTHIELQDGDDPAGHNFKDIYLKYRSAEIVSGIQSSLNRLSENASQNENKSCISPPELTLAHKIEGAILAVADPVANTSSDTVALAVKTGVIASVLAYDTAVSAVKTVAQTAVATASSITAAAKSLTGGTTANLAGNNGAAVVVARQVSPVSQASVAVAENKTISVSTANKQSISAPTSPSSVLNPEKKLFLSEKSPSAPKTEVKATTEKNSSPKLVFVGLRMSGRGSAPPLAPVEKIEVSKTEEKIEPAAEVEEELSAPALTVPQCDESLATDGCLIAETTASFEWAPISGAFYYAINKNGVYATTTETVIGITASDFSDYSFGVATVGASGQKSATSTKTISVAAIPIAINEIAWMGATASPYDEWLELKNNTGHTISLSHWAVESKDGTPRIALSGSIAPREYLVLERRANTIVVDSPVFIYGNGSSQWALGNGGEELSLSRSGTIFDSTPAIIGGAWVAGDNASKKTMERYSSKESGADLGNWTTWGTNASFIKNGKDLNGNQILGTPGACNSASYINVNGGDNITNNLTLTADNCYYISAGVGVSASSTLSVEAGVQVSLNQNNLYIDGILDARGEDNNPIVFDSFAGSATSNRIIISGKSGTSSIDNAVISNTGGVKLNNGATVEITNANFANDMAGVELNNGSTAIIENVNFASTTNEAVTAYDGSAVSIASSTITNSLNSDAIGVYGGSSVTISSTTIDGVKRGDGIGVYNSIISVASSTIKNISRGDGVGVYGGSTATIASTTIDGVSRGDGVAMYNSTLIIASSTIENVSEDGIRLSNSTSTISNAIVQNGGKNGIDIYKGTANISDTDVSGFTARDGILINSPKSPIAIADGEITGNSVGVAMTAGDAIISDGVVHNNDTNVVVCVSGNICP